MDLHRLYPRGLTELTLCSVLVLVNSATSAVARCNGCLRVSEAIPSLLLSDKMQRLVQAVLRTVGRRGAGWQLRSLQLNSAQCSLLFCCSWNWFFPKKGLPSLVDCGYHTNIERVNLHQRIMNTDSRSWPVWSGLQRAGMTQRVETRSVLLPVVCVCVHS